eukprot:GFUD01069172.1.p1 GENE.GFUD01069172.1~~GFUD01069172.1.p1  ORF type:complete len:283 (-),score=22.16 GFUD01069172.1:386-1234(-)
MKISRFCWNMELSSAALGLGICGVVMSIISIGIFTYFFFIWPQILLLFIPGNFAPTLQYMFAKFYVIGTIGLLLSLGWLLFSFILLNNAKEDETGGKRIIKISVKRIIKIGSFIIGTIQTILGCVSTLASIGCIILFSLGVKIGGVSAIILVLCFLWLIISIFFLIFPASLLIHGIRTKSSGKIRAWIILQFILWGLYIVCSLVSLGFTDLITGLASLALNCLFYMYITGMVIVHYNILLKDDTAMKMEMNRMNRNFPVTNYIVEKQNPTAPYLPNSFMVYR